ncbi:hypothetical protein A2U01_0093475, partial [Trifolium medium]|nr:hypothetical protein [Trifolium medium]
VGICLQFDAGIGLEAGSARGVWLVAAQGVMPVCVCGCWLGAACGVAGPAPGVVAQPYIYTTRKKVFGSDKCC